VWRGVGVSDTPRMGGQSQSPSVETPTYAHFRTKRMPARRARENMGTHAYTHTHAYTYIHTHMHLRCHAYTHTHIHTLTHIHTHTHTHTCTYVAVRLLCEQRVVSAAVDYILGPEVERFPCHLFCEFLEMHHLILCV
jgi:hypothetical protein